ncbi:HAD-IIA family hydrolase [Alcaligenes aquatilis]|uniref:Haloacid dehalogenase n=2 Tax=Alcaligenes TaxID=507 RepID=A0AB33D738_ALCFA|nr:MULTISPECIES: HAD family hydrolase [Alcaligenes]ASR91219.1 haloacid dehalogenase [Alcaligenes faecalis]AWG36115.1 haloacid dehalogenase [Alcaligenes aquatilis]MCC9165196.1 HAD hydrolase-like protein [Alcaligenes sp. MMA]UYY87253.1 HAD hydrolase-like protein [Alcaligenes sp. SMD-FA]HBQ89639.1 haloacid dehalogenase [Alcaligenes faecalis]
MTSLLSAAPPSSQPDAPSDASWLSQSLGLILDLDGTLIRGDEVLPGAKELLHYWEGRYIVVSNNSTHTAQTLAPQLQALGLPVPPANLVLAGEQAIHHIACRYPHNPLMLCASQALRALAMELGLTLVERNADIVLLTRDRHFSYDTLQQVIRELSQGATLLVSNADLTHPGPQGLLTPETGALLQAVLACIPGAQAEILGKPQSMLFREGLQRLGLHNEHVTVIGDNAATDALGAVSLGLGYLLVGPSSQADAPDVGALMLRNIPVRRHLHEVSQG